MLVGLAEMTGVEKNEEIGGAEADRGCWPGPGFIAYDGVERNGDGDDGEMFWGNAGGVWGGGVGWVW